MLSVDALGWLHAAPGDPLVQLVPAHASRMGPRFSSPPAAPVWHTTDVLTPAAASAEHWQAPATTGNASAHVILGRDGVIYQCVPLLRIAWHVRGGGIVGAGKVDSVNARAIGIELENVGGLRRILDAQQRPAFYGWPYWRRDASGNARELLGPDPLVRLDDFRGARAQLVGGRWCDGFTAEQLATAAALLGCLVQRFSWAREICGRGHVDYEPARKEDPWPLFRAQHLQAVLDLAFAPSP
jgi:N-acetyl-anhydromuramyl-L-alanine amidase AmpD